MEAPTAIDGHRSAQKEDCKFTVVTKRKKKSKIPRRLKKKIQERKCLKKAIFDSQEKLLQRVKDQSIDGGKEFLIAPPNMAKMSEIMTASRKDSRLSENEKGVLNFLMEIKKAFFPEIKRVILDYEYVETPKGFHINVVSNILKNDQSCSTA